MLRKRVLDDMVSILHSRPIQIPAQLPVIIRRNIAVVLHQILHLVLGHSGRECRVFESHQLQQVFGTIQATPVQSRAVREERL